MADKFNDKIDASHEWAYVYTEQTVFKFDGPKIEVIEFWLWVGKNEKKLRIKSDRLVDLKKRDFVKTIQSTSVTLDVTVPCLSS